MITTSKRNFIDVDVTHTTHVAFDGSDIWVTSTNSNTITKLQASDGAILQTFATGSIPEGVAFDGTNVWVANTLSNTVSKF